MGLKHLPLVSIMLLLLHSCWNYLWWAKPEWKAEVPWLLVEGQWKMLADFAVVIEVVSALGT
jgi:hypothetical protein